MTRPRRSFQSLLLRALVEAEAGNLGALQAEAFREEAEQHLAMGPRGGPHRPSPLPGQRGPLPPLLGGSGRGLREAPPGPASPPLPRGGYAARLAEVLCGEGVAAKPPLQGSSSSPRRRPSWPPGSWPSWTGCPRSSGGRPSGPRGRSGPRRRSRDGKPPGGGQPSFARPERKPPSPNRPRFPLVYRPRYRDREEPRGRSKNLSSPTFPTLGTSGPSGARSSAAGWARAWRSGRRTGAASGSASSRSSGNATRKPPSWSWREGGPGPDPPPSGDTSLSFPRVFRHGEEVTGEVWSWEDLRPRALAAFLREVGYYRDLLRVWLEYGLGTGRLSWKRFREALRLLEEEP